jgi:hypothetical protein
MFKNGLVQSNRIEAQQSRSARLNLLLEESLAAVELKPPLRRVLAAMDPHLNLSLSRLKTFTQDLAVENAIYKQLT